MKRFSYSLTPVVGTVRVPLVPASLVVGGVESPRMTALVDTGASFSLVRSEIVARLLKTDGAGLERLSTSRRSFAGLAGGVVGLRIPIEKMVFWKGRASLELEDPVLFCVPSLPFEMLIGQRCSLERLFLVHRNKHDEFVIGHASAFHAGRGQR